MSDAWGCACYCSFSPWCAHHAALRPWMFLALSRWHGDPDQSVASAACLHVHVAQWGPQLKRWFTVKRLYSLSTAYRRRWFITQFMCKYIRVHAWMHGEVYKQVWSGVCVCMHPRYQKVWPSVRVRTLIPEPPHLVRPSAEGQHDRLSLIYSASRSRCLWRFYGIQTIWIV